MIRISIIVYTTHESIVYIQGYKYLDTYKVVTVLAFHRMLELRLNNGVWTLYFNYLNIY